MDFTFSEDQMMFRESVAAMLSKEVTADSIRARWQTETGFDANLWQQFVEMGLTSILVPEAWGGLGLDEVDFIQLAEECGRVALPEPLVNNALVATCMLVELAALDVACSPRCIELLQQVASGAARVAAAHVINPYVNFAAEMDWMLLGYGEEVHLVSRDQVTLTAQKSLDPSRRLYRVANWKPDASTRLVDGEQGARVWRGALNRGALGVAAQMLGLASAMVGQAVQYSTEREQFGRPIGSNQAVKHLLADCAVKIEFAKPVVYRAAYTTSVNPRRADCVVSHAKVAATEAALLSARNATQVYGAMGYTWECNLHIWAKRSWALDKSWGGNGFHKNRIHEWLLNMEVPLGPENTFGVGKLPQGSDENTRMSEVN